MKFYTINNSAPAPLPFRITMPDGSTRTDSASFTDEEIAAAGYTETPAPPPYNSATQHPPQWNGSEWIIQELTEQEILDRLPPHFDTSAGIRLATGETDQTAFTRMLALIDLNQMQPTDMIVIRDAAGEKHGMTVEQFREIMKEYGAHCYSLHVGA